MIDSTTQHWAKRLSLQKLLTIANGQQFCVNYKKTGVYKLLVRSRWFTRLLTCCKPLVTTCKHSLFWKLFCKLQLFAQCSHWWHHAETTFQSETGIKAIYHWPGECSQKDCTVEGSFSKVTILFILIEMQASMRMAMARKVAIWRWHIRKEWWLCKAFVDTARVMATGADGEARKYYN